MRVRSVHVHTDQSHRRARAARRRGRLGLLTVLALCTSVLAATGMESANATQAGGHDVVVWGNNWAWTYASTFHYLDTAGGNDVTINENVTYGSTAQTTFNGQPAYVQTISGTITGGSGHANANGTNVSLSNFSGSVSGTRYVRRSDLALLQEYQHQDLKATAAGLVGITAVIDLTQTPSPSWKTHDFPLNPGDGWQYNESVAYTGGFTYNAGSFGSGSSPFDGSFPFVAPASVSSAVINAGGNSSLATDLISASTSDGSGVDNIWWAPSFKNDAKEHLVLPLSGASLTIDRNLTTASTPAAANTISATATPSLTCAGNTVTVSGSLSTGASGVPVSISLDQSQINPGQAINVATTTGANGSYSATLTAPADNDQLQKAGSRANWGILVSAPSVSAYGATTLVVSPQDCTTLAYTGDTSAAQHGSATVSAKLTDLATAANAAGRTVTFSVSAGNTVTATTDAAGVATATLPLNGPPRSATVTASVASAADLVGATASAPFTVQVDPTSTSVAPSATSLTTGDPVTFTATVTPLLGSNPGGSVQFLVDNINFGAAVPLAGGSATSPALDTSTLTLGTHTVQAQYLGDANFAPSLSTPRTFKVHVPLANTTTTETVTPGGAVSGQSVTLAATVAPVNPGSTPSGLVTFVDGGTVIGAGSLDATGHVSVTTSTLPVGPHSIVALYDGDDTIYNGSSSAPTSLTVSRADAAVTVSSSASDTVAGQAVSFTANVGVAAPGSGTATGTAQLVIDGSSVGLPVTLTGGSAVFAPVTDLHAGSHTVAVAYSGDAGVKAGSGRLTQNVSAADTTTTLSTTPSPSAEDQNVQITATVSAVAPGSGAPTGTVTFTANGDPIGAAPLQQTGNASQAVLNVSTLTPGSYTIAASFGGDDDYHASDAAGVSQTVISGAAVVATSTTLTASKNPTTYGELVSFTAKVAADDQSTPSGTVQFSLDGADFGDPVALGPDGTATSVTLASPDPGDHTVIAAFLPAAGYSASGDTLTQTVSDAQVGLDLASSAPNSGVGQSVRFTATVSSLDEGTADPAGFVQFRVDGKNLGSAVPISAGTALSSAVSTLKPGAHAVTAVYSGDIHFAAAVTTISQSVGRVATATTLAASATSTTYGQPIGLTATVTPAQTDLGVPDGTVSFLDGSTVLGTAPVVASGSVGRASVTLGFLGAGSHAVKAVYSGSGSFQASASAPALAITVAKRATTMKTDAAILKISPPMYGAYGQLRITLSSGIGPVVGVPVSFAIGTTVICPAAITDNNGVATCNASSQILQLTLYGGYKASFAGNANYLSVSAQGVVLK